MRTVFLRVLEAEDRAEALRQAVEAGGRNGAGRCDVDVRRFASVPRSPFAYWVSERVRRLFVELPPFEADGRTAKQGLATADDFRFVRAWWEVRREDTGRRWFPFAKGGEYSPFYADIYLVLNWASDGAEIRSFHVDGGERLASRPQNTDYYLRPGLTWPLRGVRFSAQAVPAGCVFSVAGKMAFVPDDNPVSWLALFNSTVFDQLIAVYAGKVGGVQYEVGLIQSLPVPDVRASEESLSSIARRGWGLQRSLDLHSEASHAFRGPAGLANGEGSLSRRAVYWKDEMRKVQERLAEVQREVDTLCLGLYSFGQSAGAASGRSLSQARDERNEKDGLGASRTQAMSGTVSGGASMTRAPRSMAADLFSWALGVVFGRFDVRMATGDREPPPEPDPFDPLPPCSPGMLTGDDGLPVLEPPPGYPFAVPPDGILVDDQGHANDIVARVRAVFDAVFGDDADARWQEAAELVDPRSRDVRQWLARDFFPRHLRMYSKSRRKAPIYWQLATPSASYSVWLYYHRFTRDTLFRVLSEYVTPKLRHEERRLMAVTQEAGQHPTPGQRRDIAAQEAFVAELREFGEELGRVAPLWEPDLDDGVIVNFAPLWRLIGHQKAWQRQVQGCWARLVAGDYDWAHLAMHLWPGRVVAKCAQDRSLAIAHGLEDALWVEDAGGKWRPRGVGGDVFERLVAERSSPAVKAALASQAVGSGEGLGDGRRAAGGPSGP